MLRLSQSALTLLAYCPRRFQHTVLDALAVPPSPQQWAAQQWGDRFHLLMQQRELGLPIDPLLAGDDELQAAFSALTQAAPDLLETTETLRQSEHRRSLHRPGYSFTVIYDLLRLWPQRGEIIDWKTYRQPKSADRLLADWQTRLYCYVLVETSDLTPEQVTMVYWFVRPPTAAAEDWQPQSVRLPYSRDRHHQTHQDLAHHCDRLTQWLATGEPFPQVPVSPAGLEKCRNCPFTVRCQRPGSPGDPSEAIPPLDAIPEIAL